MSRGFTLVETGLALVVLAIVVAFAAPRAVAIADRQHVARAAERIALAHRRARHLAQVSGTPVQLLLRTDTLAVRWHHDTLARRWHAPGPAADGAELVSGADSMHYAPNGLAAGAANARHVVRRGRATAEVLVSRLGRVRIVRRAGRRCRTCGACAAGSSGRCAAGSRPGACCRRCAAGRA